MSEQKCPIHNIIYDMDYYRCGICGGEGFYIGDFDEIITCFQCKGEGEYEVPVCHYCDDEYQE